MLFLYSLLLGITGVCSLFVYDENVAMVSLKLSQSAYCLNTTSNWDCSTCDGINTLYSVIENKGSQAIVGYNEPNDAIFVAFRGSENIQNWINNIRISKVNPYPEFADISVEKGFYVSYQNIKPQIESNVRVLSEKYNTNSIMVTGHSLGGAMASLMVFDVLNGVYDNVNLLPFFTFGSPRVGNNEFVSKMNSYKSQMFRVTHYYDIVPHVPEEVLGYLHITNEIWYNEDNTQYTQCNDLHEVEDSQCSDSCAPIHCTSTDDHMYYIYLEMGSSNC